MPRSAETASFKLNHTMLRIKDPQASLKFYRDILGMDLLHEQPLPGFTLYFLGFDHGSELPAEQRANARFDREGVLELTHNHGTENEPEFHYADSNKDPHKGYGHIAVSVDNVDKACERFDRLGATFRKRPTEGTMKGIAFLLDPDGYWVEIVPRTVSI